MVSRSGGQNRIDEVIKQYLEDRISTARAVRNLFSLGLDGIEVGKVLNPIRVGEFGLPPLKMEGLDSYKDYEEVYLPYRKGS